MSSITGSQDTLDAQTVLTDEMLARFAKRAPQYDRENAFFTDDFEELRQADYLRLAVPRELGGAGFTLAAVAQQQRRLGVLRGAHGARDQHAPVLDRQSPPTSGERAITRSSGCSKRRWRARSSPPATPKAATTSRCCSRRQRRNASRAATASPGASRSAACRRSGRIWGFTAWTPPIRRSPKIVHAFMPRDTEGYRIEQTWDVLGMRATRSDDTILDGVFVPDRYIVRVVPAGAAGIDAFVLGLFAWALLGFGNIYYGLAHRALDLTLEAVKSKRSIALTRTMAYHAEVQHRVAEMGLAFESIGPHLDRIADDWSNGVDHGAAWPAKIFAAKYHAVEDSWRIVDTALELAGGFGIFRRSGIERLFRDARLGRIHPANSLLTHEIVGKTLLGISPDETPRWG